MSALALALAAAVGQLADGASWAMAVGRYGLGPESNPLARSLGAADTDLVLLVKVGGAVVCAALAWRLAGRRWSYLPTLVGLFGAVTNLWAPFV